MTNRIGAVVLASAIIGMVPNAAFGSGDKAVKKGAEGHKTEEAEKNAKPVGKEYIQTDGYVHHWLEFPPVNGKAVKSGEAVTVTPNRGEPMVLIFLASWCLPCQKLSETFESLRTRYTARHTRFVYVFAHDTRADSLAFAKEHKLQGEMMLAAQESLKNFHEPQLPSIFVSDRAGWLVERYINVTQANLQDLDGFLAKHTSF